MEKRRRIWIPALLLAVTLSVGVNAAQALYSREIRMQLDGTGMIVSIEYSQI